MTEVTELILKRRSVRAYEEREIPAEERAEILKATLRAPTAGNLMLYSILEISDQSLKDRLAVTCDKQPFIARAPMVWVFLADYQRWYDTFLACGVEEECAHRQVPMQKPEESDLFLASCDALIAAQTAVLAAESFGIGSCYIGDIMEQYETHRDLLALPQYVFPICMLVFGYPTEQQMKRTYTNRFPEEHIVFQNQYRRLDPASIEAMLESRKMGLPKEKVPQDIRNIGRMTYWNKFNADFSKEMRRSVREWLKNWES